MTDSKLGDKNQRCVHGVWPSDHCWTCGPNKVYANPENTAARDGSGYVNLPHPIGYASNPIPAVPSATGATPGAYRCPRTDALARDHYYEVSAESAGMVVSAKSNEDCYREMRDLASQLERELAEAKRLITRMDRTQGVLHAENVKQRERAERAEAALSSTKQIEWLERAENAEAQLSRLLHLQEQVVGRVWHRTDGEVVANLNSIGTELPDGAALYTEPRIALPASELDKDEGRDVQAEDELVSVLMRDPALLRQYVQKCCAMERSGVSAREQPCPRCSGRILSDSDLC